MKNSYRTTIWTVQGRCYGFRFSIGDRDDFKQWECIPIVLDDDLYCFKISDSFWRKCPEVRGKAIERWLQRRNVTMENKHRYAVILKWHEDRFIPKLVPY